MFCLPSGLETLSKVY